VFMLLLHVLLLMRSLLSENVSRKMFHCSSSFLHSLFVSEILRVKDCDLAPLVICGNKCDLESERQVSKAEGQELAKSFGAPFMETSAKARVNVEESFFQLVREIRKTCDGDKKLKKLKKKGACRLL